MGLDPKEHPAPPPILSGPMELRRIDIVMSGEGWAISAHYANQRYSTSRHLNAPDQVAAAMLVKALAPEIEVEVKP